VDSTSGRCVRPLNSELGGAIFVVEDLTSDPSTHGAFMHGVEEIGLITNDGYCFHYDLGFVTDSRRAKMHFRKVWCYREHATDFAIRIVHGWRCRFVEFVLVGRPGHGTSTRSMETGVGQSA
jgi:hypothetical protein